MKILPGFFVWWMISSQLVGGAEVKPVEIGLFPFTNLTQDRNLDPWCRWLPEMLQTELVNASQRNFEVYLHGIRRQLTNAGWNGVQPVRRELAQSLSAKLHLDRMILGSFSRDGNGWSVKLEVVKLGLERPGALLNFHESQISKLRVALAVGLCDALGAKPYSESLAVWRNHPISDEAITKCSGLGDDLENGKPPGPLAEQLKVLVSREPEWLAPQELLVTALLEADQKAEAEALARKLIEKAPRLCAGHIALGYCLEGKEKEQENCWLQALKVHPGCMAAAWSVFGTLARQERWGEIKDLAQQAHEAMPGELFHTMSLAAALANLGERKAAHELISNVEFNDMQDEPGLHSMLVQAALKSSLLALGRELLWLQRHSQNNPRVKEMLADVDASFWLKGPPGQTNSPPPRLLSGKELDQELARRLTPEERSLVENPVASTAKDLEAARALTAGLTNRVLKAVLLFAKVAEERVETERSFTNSGKPGKMPVCHYYASRLVSLARSIGIGGWLVHVELADEDVSMYHDQAALQPGNEVLIFDPTLGVINDVRAENARILDDVQAIAHHLLQGKDLPRIRVAQKLDNDPWTRMAAIINLAGLDHVDEAEELWKALGPECTNRWDYYFSRAAIEKAKGKNATAITWMERAAAISTNNPQIELHLGDLYGSVGQNEKTAEHLAKALKLGAAREELSKRAEVESAMNFSRAVADATRMTPDQLRASARAGELHAQLVLAKQLINEGQTEEGLKWLEAAARQGDALAQGEYGHILSTTKGAGPKALVWLRKAAQQEYWHAYYDLALLLYKDEGVPKDEVEASMWAHLSQAAGDPQARSLIKELELFADRTAFAEGKKRAEARLAKGPQ